MNSPINSNKRKGKIDKEFGYAEDKCFCSIFLHIGFASTLVWDHLEPAQLRVYISNQQADVISKDVTSTMKMSQCLDDSDLKIGNTKVNMFKTKPGFVFFGERSGGSSVTISWEADWR